MRKRCGGRLCGLRRCSKMLQPGRSDHATRSIFHMHHMHGWKEDRTSVTGSCAAQASSPGSISGSAGGSTLLAPVCWPLASTDLRCAAP